MENVFGNPITDSTLRQMSEYVDKEEITAVDRAHVAMNMKNANEKDRNARTYVENLKKQWGTGVSTLCVVYNATGNTIRFVGSKDWFGHRGQASYPEEIENGQWGAFLHVKDSGAASGSMAAVLYRGKNGNEGKDCDYMMAWSNPWLRTAHDNSVWTEACEVDHFRGATWDGIYGKLSETRYTYSHTWKGCSSSISTESDTSPVVEATFTLKDAVKA